MQITEFAPVSFGAITLTIICISSLQIFKSCSLLTYILFSAHRAPWWVLTKKTMAKPPAKRRTGRMDKLKCRSRKTTKVMSLPFFATIYSAIISGTALVLKPRAFFLWGNSAKHTALLSLVWVYFSGQWPSVNSDLIFTEEKRSNNHNLNYKESDKVTIKIKSIKHVQRIVLSSLKHWCQTALQQGIIQPCFMARV